MSLEDCVEKLRGDEIPARIADEALRLREKLMERSRQVEEISGFTEEQIDNRVLETLKKQNVDKEFQDLLKIEKEIDALNDAQSYRSGEDKEIINTVFFGTRELKLAEGAISTVTGDLGGDASIRNLETMIKSRRSEYMSMITELASRSQRDFFNAVKDDRIGRDVLRHILDGEAPTKEGKTLGESVRKMLDLIRKDYTLQGGILRQLEDYFPNPLHDVRKLRSMDKEKWVESVVPRLDKEKMFDYQTEQPISELPDEQATKRLREIVGQVYDSITNNGNYGESPGVKRGAILAKKREGSRVLHFESADDWLAYQREFGKGENPFEPLTNYIDAMSREISAMERFGPNPKRTKRILGEMIIRKGDELNERSLAKSNKETFDNLFETALRSNMGATNTKTDHYISAAQRTVRANVLGTATLAAVPGDISFTALARAYNGMPITRSIMTMIKSYADQVKKNPEMAKKAQEAGLIVDAYKGKAMSQARLFGEMRGVGLSKVYSDQMMRKSGLEGATIGARAANGIETARWFNDVKHLSWEELKGKKGNIIQRFLGPKAGFRQALERYGFNKSDWDVIQQVEAFEDGGLSMLRPVDVATEEMVEKTGRSMDELREIQHKYQEFVFGEMEYMVPSGTTRAQAFLSGKQDSKWGRALSRSIKMFTYFPITMMHGPLSRIFVQPGMANKLKLATTTGIALTMAGAVQQQLKRLAEGKELVDVTDVSGPDAEGVDFWMKSFTSGGFGGIYGDLLFRGTDKSWMSLAGSLFGPDVQFTEDLLKLAGGNVIRAISPSQETNVLQKGTDFLQRWAPPGNLWYLQALKNRTLYDNLYKASDAKAYLRFRRMKNRERKEFDSSYFIEPGSIDSPEALLTEPESPDGTKLIESALKEGE